MINNIRVQDWAGLAMCTEWQMKRWSQNYICGNQCLQDWQEEKITWETDIKKI